MLHLCAAFSIFLLLLGGCPMLLNADTCNSSPYHPITEVSEYAPRHSVRVEGCAHNVGCYEYYTKSPGHIQYRAGCGASECPVALGFDARLHTCVRCKVKATDTVPAAGDTLCSSASIVSSIGRDSTWQVCPFMVSNYVKDKEGNSIYVDTDAPLGIAVYCNTDTKCGTMLWLNVASGNMETNYTGCISDCNKAFLDAGGSGKCIECHSALECLQKRPTTFVKVYAAGLSGAGMSGARMSGAGVSGAGMSGAGVSGAGVSGQRGGGDAGKSSPSSAAAPSSVTTTTAAHTGAQATTVLGLLLSIMFGLSQSQ